MSRAKGLEPVFDVLLDELAKRVAALILEELRTPRTHYGSGPKAILPPGKSRAWALRTLKTIPSARKVGRDWVIAIDEYEAWLTEQDSERARKGPGIKKASPATPDVDALAEKALVAGGFRLTR